MSYTFQSSFANDILAYIKLRMSLGNKKDTFARRLHAFDAYCCLYHPQELIMTQEIAEGWCTLKPNEKVVTLSLRTRILRGFAKYLKTIGKEAYIIPDGFVGKREQFLPYLYTEDQLKAFFSAADKLPPHKLSPMREYVIPVLFRMLYCCGLRPQEVRHLRVTDVDLTNGILCIVNSKRNKDRLVVMSTALTSLCQRYHQMISQFLLSRIYFFENPNGGEYSATWIQNQFFKCWKYAGISFEKQYHPRIFDWRHNFATHTIIQWIRDGRNVTNLLPYLSSYMGHESIEYTAYYIHLIPEHLKSLECTDWACTAEVPSYED